MAKIADRLRLTPEEVDEILERERHLRIATIGPGAEINLTPMTFGWAGGRVFLFGRGQKIANLRRSSTATVLIDVGESWRDLQGIMMRGQAHVLENQAAESAETHLTGARLNLGMKHGLRDAAGVVKPYDASASGNSRRWIVFVPQKIVTWNNQRL